MTHNPPHPTLIPSLTPFSPFQSAHTHTHSQLLLHLICSLAHTVSLPLSVAATLCPSVPLPLSSRLSAAPRVFPHGFVNAALSHTPDMLRVASEWQMLFFRVCVLRFPPVRQLFILANHSAAAARDLKSSRTPENAGLRTCAGARRNTQGISMVMEVMMMSVTDDPCTHSDISTLPRTLTSLLLLPGRISVSHVCLCYVRTLPHHLTFWCQLHVHLEHGRLAADSDASAVLE